MTDQEKKKKLEEKARELLKFAEDKKLSISATQKITPEGYIENAVLFKDLEVYPEESEAPKITDAEATPK